MGRTSACWLAIAIAAAASVGCGDDTGSGASGAGGSGGGGGGDPAASRYASGDRLKIQVQRAGDAEQFWSVFDSELDAACYIQVVSDGSLRCAPTGGAFLVYGDAACSDAFVSYYAGGCEDNGPGKYLTTFEDDSDGCAGTQRARVFAIGAAVANPPATIFQLDYEGNCYEAGAGANMFELGAELAPDELVLVDVATEPRGDALSVDVFQTDDGFRLLGYTPHDVVHDVACAPGELGAEKVCQPSGPSGSFDAFTDAACSGAGGVFFTGGPGCESASMGSVVVYDPDDMCTYAYHAYQVGAAVDATFALQDGTCVETTDPLQGPRLIGEQIPDADFPGYEIVEEGTGAVRFSSAYAGGAPLVVYGSFVTDAGEPCYPYSFADGTVRCGPPTLAYVSADPNRYYADSACTDVLVVLYDDPCNLQPEPELAVVAGDVDSCVVTEGIHEIGAAHTGVVFINDSIQGCIEIASGPETSYRALGNALPNETFTEVTIETL